MKLFRSWSSSFALRIVWALEIKGIEYEAVFEDLSNKSPLLLQYNPVHKKIPILVFEEKFPLLYSWMQDFAEPPIIRDNWPPRDKMIVKFQALLDAAIASLSLSLSLMGFENRRPSTGPQKRGRPNEAS